MSRSRRGRSTSCTSLSGGYRNTRPVRSSVAVNDCKSRLRGPGSLMMSKRGYNSQTDGELAPPSSKSIRLDPDDAQSVSGTKCMPQPFNY